MFTVRHMKTQLLGLAVAAGSLITVAGCSSGTTTAGGSPTTSDSPSYSAELGAAASASPSTGGTDAGTGSDSGSGSGSGSTAAAPQKTTTRTTATTEAAAGPEIVYFKIAQKPKCAEGTDVYTSPAVPLVIKWKITGATSAALSVDDPTDTPGTYGSEGLTGSQEFSFSCAEANSTETHTYVIYSVGGGTQKHKKLTVSVKVPEKTTVS